MSTPAEQKHVAEWEARFIADWQALWAKDLCAARESREEESVCAETGWTQAWKTGFQEGWNEGLWKGRKSEAPHTARVLAARRMLAQGKYEELMISAATKLTCAEIRKLAEEPGALPEAAPVREAQTPDTEEAYAAGYREGMEAGRREGVLESRQMATKFIAMRMLDLGRFTKEEVAAATALPMARIEALYVPSMVRQLPTRTVGENGCGRALM